MLSRPVGEALWRLPLLAQLQRPRGRSSRWSQPRSRVASSGSGRKSHRAGEHQNADQRTRERTPKDWASLVGLLNERVTGLPRLVGFRIDHVEYGRVVASLPIQPSLLAANGYLHAGSIVTLADTACGYGCYISLPPNRINFATVQLSSQFLGTALSGDLEVEAWLRHAGRTTQVWDAEVRTRATPETRGVVHHPIALFRCTQLLLEAKSGTNEGSDSARDKSAGPSPKFV